jgi:ferredoxin
MHPACRYPRAKGFARQGRGILPCVKKSARGAEWGCGGLGCGSARVAEVVRILIQPRGVLLETTEAGARLLDLLDEQSVAGVPLSCRGARCGVCRVRVERGLECFEPPGLPERETLTALGAGAAERLGCQLRLAAGVRGEAELALLSAPPADGP